MFNYLRETVNLPEYLLSIIILALALIISNIGKSVIKKVLSKVNQKSNNGVLKGEDIDVIGNFAFLLILFLFLPEILNQFGLSKMYVSVNNVVDNMISFIPNLIGFAMIIFIGSVIAKTLKSIIEFALKKINIDKLQEKIGINGKVCETLSEVGGKLVYAIIMIMSITMALTALDMPAVSIPALNMLNSVTSYLPKILISGFIILLSLFISKIIGEIIKSLISCTGIDSMFIKLIQKESDNNKFILSNFISSFVKLIINLILFVEAINILELEVLKNFGVSLINFLPNIVTGVLIAVIAYIGMLFLDKKLTERNVNPYIITIAKVVVILIGAFMALNQFKIASFIVNTTYILLVGSFAVSFAMGSKDIVHDVLKRIIK